MIPYFYYIFQATFIIALLVSLYFVIAASTMVNSGRPFFGWLGGIFLSVFLFYNLQSYFNPSIVNESIKQNQIDYIGLICGIVFCFILLKSLEYIFNLPSKALAFIFLFESFLLLSILLYANYIGTYASMLFSSAIGLIVWLPIHFAFFMDIEKMDIDDENS